MQKAALLFLVVALVSCVKANPSSLECSVCMSSVSWVRELVEKYGNEVIQYIKPICKVIGPFLNQLIGHSECSPKIPQTCIDLCEGMITSWGPTLVDVFAALDLDPATDCGRIGACPPPPNGTKPIYPKPNLTPSGTMKNPGKGSIFHISDIHYDRNYAIGARTDCGLPVCCHSVYGPGNPGGGTYGDYNCDVPEVTVKGMLHQIAVHTPNYVVYTGDTPAHDLWLQTHELNVGAILNITKWTLEVLPNTTQYFPCLGNHAGAPVDEFGGPAKDFWLYGPIGDAWSKFLPKEAIVSFKWGGYYTAVMEPGLRVIALQTNYYDSMNEWLDPAKPDIAGQFAWFEDVLSQIQALGEKAFVIGHEKPQSFATGPWQNMYLTLATKYKDTIIGSFWGHNHYDFFQVLHDPKSNGTVPVGVALMSPAVTPNGNTTNPSYRLVSYDQKQKLLLDYDQYRVDFMKANKVGYLTWELAYSALKGYGISDFSPASWQKAGERVGSDVQAWNFFRSVYHGGVEVHGQDTIDKNQRAAMCMLLGDSDENHSRCMKSPSSH